MKAGWLMTTSACNFRFGAYFTFADFMADAPIARVENASESDSLTQAKTVDFNFWSNNV